MVNRRGLTQKSLAAETVGSWRDISQPRNRNKHLRVTFRSVGTFFKVSIRVVVFPTPIGFGTQLKAFPTPIGFGSFHEIDAIF